MAPGSRFLHRGETATYCQLTESILQLMHPVLESLRDTDRQWLIDTLYAFNSGNVERFQTLKTAWGQQVSPGGLAERPRAVHPHVQSLSTGSPGRWETEVTLPS